jgi:hypothetical protein
MFQQCTAVSDCSSEKELADLDSHIQQLNFRLRRVLKNVKTVRESCKTTAQVIGEINGHFENHK